MTPIELLIGRKMNLESDPKIRQILEEEMIERFQEEGSELREKAISNLIQIQEENRKTANKRRKKATSYKQDDLVAILRTQRGPGLKLHPKFFGPYKIVSVLRNNRYLVERVGDHAGPFKTSTSADHMKRWPSKQNPDFMSDSDSDDSISEDNFNEDVE